MTTAEREDQARAIIAEYCEVPELIKALAPYYANILQVTDDSDQIIMRGMVNAALDYEELIFVKH